MNKRLKSDILLLLTAFIWGSAFVAQKVGADIGTFTFNGIRTFIGGLALLPVILILDSMQRKKGNGEAPDPVQKAADRKVLLAGGLSCGIVLFIASTLQQYGIFFTTAGKSGFITSLYAVIVPFLAIAAGKRVKKIIWLCVILGVTGLYLLCMTPGEAFRIQRGDFFVLLCAFAFAVHIMVIDYFSPKTNGVKMSCIQFLTAGAIGIVCMFIFEEPSMTAILHSWFPILYAGVFSCGIAYTLQIVAQADADPSEASLILCLESVFSVITGAIMLHESMAVRGYLGCALIFAAVVMSQLPSREERLAAKSR
ncbi:DMT family transporter [Hornefia butyriciproducens]|uniref:DMT family transporter n=1 Tax=Hornefia butyriciproducens TaxID=2652293 RepID=UPI002A91921C|nr:DMT family transporter [Hornefia butyriciproducens]MDY5423507.1 DMT family transporter [Hornefia butyriciproducens]